MRVFTWMVIACVLGFDLVLLQGLSLSQRHQVRRWMGDPSGPAGR